MKFTNVMLSKTFILLLLLIFACAGNNPQEPDDEGIDENLPEFVEYQAIIALQQPTHGNLLLSGGGSGVRTTTNSIGIDEKWQLLNLIDLTGSGQVGYRQLVALQLPEHGGLKLSGSRSDGARTSTFNISFDETWIIVNAEDPSKIGEPVRYGDRIALARASSNPQYLSGGDSGVRITTSIGVDETWQIIHSGE